MIKGLGAYVNHSKLAKLVHERLKKEALFLATAESCTGGLLGHALTEISGISEVYLGGVIAYNNTIKTKMLSVPSPTLKRYGAVSEECALLMASGVRNLFKADIGIGITGIAGPSGGSKTKPVGLVYIAITDNRRSLCEAFHFKGPRSKIKQQSATQTFSLLLKFIH